MCADSVVVDLDACDREPVHIIGAVQPHGALIAADATSLDIVYASTNCEDCLGESAQRILTMRLPELLGQEACDELLQRPLDPDRPDLLKPWYCRVEPGSGGARDLECLPHRHDGHILLEFMPREDGGARFWDEDVLRQRIISELVRPDALEELAHVSAEIVRFVTGFDRVMIYRFAEDKHGEVIAESTVREDSFLGLHYPASDIPDPARRHFELNLIRAIPDINARPSPILMRSGETADAGSSHPLDLTYSKLRAVAPVHIEYLNNMGVEASMSISLTANDALWGLVACHHYEPRRIPMSRLRFAELIGATVSSLLQSIENTAQLSKSIDAEKVAHAIEMEVRRGRSLRSVVVERAMEIAALIGAKGMVASLGGEKLQAGTLADPPVDYARLRPLLDDGIATSANMPSLVPMTEHQWQVAAGAAFLELSDDGEDFLVLVREEFEQTIKWAGKPEKVERRLEDGSVRLSPRGSFALWREERRGQSAPFSASDSEALRILRRALLALNSLERERAAVLAQKQAEAEKARLRLALLDAARKSSMGELASALAHELSQPLYAVTNYVSACRQELRNAGGTVPERVDTMIDEAVGESSRAADLVRRLRDFISHGDLAAEAIDLHEAIQHGLDLALIATTDPHPDVRTDFAGELPPVWADPVQIGQVVLNLTRNSITAMEHSTSRVLSISTRLAGDKAEVSISDTGHGIPDELAPTLFEPFHHSTSRGMGIGLSLCRSIVEAHTGEIWTVPRQAGAEIVFSLPISGEVHDGN